MARREERPIVIPGADDPNLALEGIFVAGEPDDERGAVVAPPHPLYGGHLESPVVGEVSYACTSDGMATVRFNWRGVGASGGAKSGDPGDATADYGRALEHLAESVRGPLAACGYSFGAATALAVGATHPRVDRMILVAPPAAMIDPETLVSFGGRVLVVAGGADEIAPAEPWEAALADAERVVVAVIEDADHFFMSGLGALGKIARGWLESPL